MKPIRFAIVIAAASIGLFAQGPKVASNGVFNSASYIPSCAPNGAIAQGSIFVLFGENLGPAALSQVSKFPIATSLAGTTVRVTVNGTSVDALPIYATATQVAALLPSKTPVGMGTVSVSYQGQSSAPVPIRVGRSAFGIYTLNQAGNGAAVGQIADGGATPVSTVSLPIRAGQVMILWGTGLGPVTPDEAAGPLPNEPKDIQANVWVGDRQAKVIYQGRSGCCAGLDQIVFEVPSGVTGCYVPVAVEIGGIYSNYASISIAAPGQNVCPDATPTTPASDKTLSTGIVSFTDTEISFPGTAAQRSISVNADFEKISPKVGGVDVLQTFRQAFASAQNAPPLSCSIAIPSQTAFSETGNTTRVGLDAGPQMTLAGPGGSKTIRMGGKGSFNGRFSDTASFADGTYQLSNGSGGADVGAFSVNLEYSTARLTTVPAVISRSQDLTLKWSVPANSTGYAVVSGTSVGSCVNLQVTFSCTARISDGQITVPARIMGQLPVSQPNGGTLLFGTIPQSGSIKPFNAPGLDLGIAIMGSYQLRPVAFE